MVFWYILIIVTFIWLVFATIMDLKTREVPDWLNYSLIIIGLGSNLLYSLFVKDFNYFLFSIIGFGVFFVIANIMYYTKQWGGGDCKLLMGLGAIFGNYEPLSLFSSINKLPFLATLLVNIFIAGAFYGIVYAIYLAFRNKKKFLIEFKKTDFKFFKISFLILLIFNLVGFFIFENLLFKMLIFISFIVLIGLFLVYFIRAVENSLMYNKLEVTKLTEGDWLVNDVFKNGKLICKARNIGLTKEDIIALKKNKIKEVLIKDGIPFVPGFLIGFILSIVFGDLILFLI